MKNLVDDHVYHYTASNGFGAQARITVFEVGADPRYVVVISEPQDPDYDGPSVTNNVEVIAAGVVMGHVLPSSATLFFEHYPASVRGGTETFDRMCFSHTEVQTTLRCGRWVMELGTPEWRPSSREELEELIGGQFR